MVEITAVQRVSAQLEQAGFDPREIAGRSTLAPARAVASNGFAPLADFCSYYQAAADTLGDPELGLAVAEAAEPADYGMIGHLYKVQPTIEEALDKLEYYYNQFLAEAETRVERLNGQTKVSLVFAHEHVGLQLLRQEILAINLLTIRRYASRPVIPLAVTLTQPEGDAARYRSVFGIDVTFGAEEDALLLPSDVLSEPIETADPKLARLLFEGAEAHLAKRREASGSALQRLRLDGCVVDLHQGVIYRGGEETPLTTKERELLTYFSQRPNEVVTHEDLERDVWQLGKSVVSHAPAVAIRRLRQKIESKPRRPINLVTVFGEGWRLSLPDPESTTTASVRRPEPPGPRRD